MTSIVKTEGVRGLWRGTTLALFGVSNGAIQFMAYEEMKKWGFDRKKRQFAKAGREFTPTDDKLVSHIKFKRTMTFMALQSNTSYTIMSATSKLVSLSLTYPYQVVRSRIQVNSVCQLV